MCCRRDILRDILADLESSEGQGVAALTAAGVRVELGDGATAVTEFLRPYLKFRARGTPYVIVNQGETPHDELSSLRIDDDVGRVLPPAIEVLKKSSN